MQKSEQIAEFAEALCKAQAEFPPILKRKTIVVSSAKGNYEFKYAPLGETIDLIRRVLVSNGLSFTQGVEGEFLLTTILHKSGQWMTYSMPLPDTPSAQQYGSQMTYRRRYSLKAALGIETDDDDEGTAATPEKKEKIKPTVGAWDAIPTQEHERLRRLANSIVDYHTNGQPDEAYRIYSQIKTNEEKIAVWSALAQFSKVRRSIKDIDEQKRKA